MGRRKETRLEGLNPLSYMGIEASDSPILMLSYNRAPTSSDSKSFRIGTIWHDTSASPIDVYILVSLNSGSATWIKILTTSGVATQYDTDSGTATPSSGDLNILGDSVLGTSGSGSTVTFGFATTTDGQVIIGGSSSSAWGNITSVGGTITITEGANSINLETSGSSALLTLTSDSGTATEAAGNINILGGTNLNTAGAGSTLTTALDTNVDISGSLTLSAQSDGVLSSDAGGVISSSKGTDGQVLIGSTGAASQWANITSTDGSIVVTNGANSISLDQSTVTNRYAFMAFQGTASNYILGGSSCPGYYLGNSSTLGQMTEVFDAYSVFDPGSAGTPATFTAPIDGKYYLCMRVLFKAFGTLVPVLNFETENFFTLKIVTNNRTYTNMSKQLLFFDVTYEYVLHEIYVCADMDSGDTATYFVNITNTFTSYDYFAVQDTSGYRDTWVCGYLL